MWVPLRIGRPHVQLPTLGTNVWIVHVRTEHDLRPGVNFVVFIGEEYAEFENCIRVQPAPEKDYAVEGTEGGEGWEDVDAGGGVLFEVFVFDGYFVVA